MVRNPDERPSCWARYPGPMVPHVAISREERDLAHAGYEVHVLKLTAMRATRGSKDQLRDGTHYKHTIRGFINVDWQIYLCASALLPVSSVEVFPGRSGLLIRFVYLALVILAEYGYSVTIA